MYTRTLTFIRSRSSDPSDDNAVRYLLPVLWITSCLPIIGQAKATPIGRILEVTHHEQHRKQSLMTTIPISFSALTLLIG